MSRIVPLFLTTTLMLLGPVAGLRAEPATTATAEEQWGRQGRWGDYDRGRGNFSEASRRGYEDGYRDGRNDARDGDRFEPTRKKKYRNGDSGYHRSFGSKDRYRMAYRQAFRDGYERGYRESVRGRRW